MPKVTPIEIAVNPRYELNVTNLTGYLIEDLLTPKEFDSLLSYWEQSHVHGIDWDKTIYYFKGKAHATANQRTFFDLYDRKIFDLPENQEWYYQTKDTIHDWARETLGRSIHPRIFQIFENDNLNLIEEIILTASGGPFFNSTKNFAEITVAEALKHPNWQMGAKISIDSATMMNKGLEMIEAFYLFPIAKK